MMEIIITTEYITLGQFLKLAELIQSGGQAKHFIQSNEIFVNDEKESRRGKKLYNNDKINIIGVGNFYIRK